MLKNFIRDNQVFVIKSNIKVCDLTVDKWTSLLKKHAALSEDSYISIENIRALKRVKSIGQDLECHVEDASQFLTLEILATNKFQCGINESNLAESIVSCEFIAGRRNDSLYARTYGAVVGEVSCFGHIEIPLEHSTVFHDYAEETDRIAEYYRYWWKKLSNNDLKHSLVYLANENGVVVDNPARITIGAATDNSVSSAERQYACSKEIAMRRYNFGGQLCCVFEQRKQIPVSRLSFYTDHKNFDGGLPYLVYAFNDTNERGQNLLIAYAPICLPELNLMEYLFSI